MNMIPIAKPLLGEEEKRAVREVLDSGWLVQGPKVKAFEEAFAKYIGTKHAVAIASGTAALHASMLVVGLEPGDKVITTPFSFIASSNCIRFCGAEPVFVDIDPETFNIDPNLIDDKITEKTKAILPVHLYGNPAKMDDIVKIAEKHGLAVVEDTAQAHGAELDGKKCGSLGDMGVFSFYPSKNMTTGEGGMITTNNDTAAEKLRLIRNHGQTASYVHDFLGYNYRMTEMAAAIGTEQLKKLEGFNKKRIANAKLLSEGLEGIPDIVTPKRYKNARHVHHLCTIRVLNGKRDHVQKYLAEKKIDARVIYPVPIHQQSFYLNKGYGSFSEAEKAANEVLCLPVHPALSQEDLETIVKAVKEAVG